MGVAGSVKDLRWSPVGREMRSGEDMRRVHLLEVAKALAAAQPEGDDFRTGAAGAAVTGRTLTAAGRGPRHHEAVFVPCTPLFGFSAA